MRPDPLAAVRPAATSVPDRPRGRLIMNADDWGRDYGTTRAILDGVRSGAVSAVSAMVFMADSERAARIARERSIDAGLHLNFTTPLSGPRCPGRVADDQARLAAHLTRHRFTQVVYRPGLARMFRDVLRAQIDEFDRLYGTTPVRFDGHHHMHLCANLLLPRLLPAGSLVRRSFSFEAGERNAVNRLYRRLVDAWLARRHRVVDFFFSLSPLVPPDRLRRIFALAREHVVEVETHPIDPDEYRFLIGGELFRRLGDLRVAPPPVPGRPWAPAQS